LAGSRKNVVRLFSALLDIVTLCLIEALRSRIKMQTTKILSVKTG